MKMQLRTLTAAAFLAACNPVLAVPDGSGDGGGRESSSVAAMRAQVVDQMQQLGRADALDQVAQLTSEDLLVLTQNPAMMQIGGDHLSDTQIVVLTVVAIVAVVVIVAIVA
jgi:hypothetical protein